MTIERIVEVPAGRRIYLDLPAGIPVGAKARIECVITREGNAPPDAAGGFQKHFDEIFGSFKDRGVFGGDSAELIRKMRNEW
jgi:hypothetical protein